MTLVVAFYTLRENEDLPLQRDDPHRSQPPTTPGQGSPDGCRDGDGSYWGNIEYYETQFGSPEPTLAEDVVHALDSIATPGSY